MLCCEKVVSDQPDPEIATETPSTNCNGNGGNGGGGGGRLRRNKGNVRFTDLKRLAEESDDEVAAAAAVVGPLQNGTAKMNGDAGGEPVTWMDADADDLSTAVVVTFGQGDETDDEGTSVTSRDGMALVTEHRAPAAETDVGDVFKETDDGSTDDTEIGCCMQCAYFIVELCSCSIM